MNTDRLIYVGIYVWLIVAALAITVAACESSVKAPRVVLRDGPIEASTAPSDRFEIARVAAFDDSLAYGGERGVYTIKDRVTGKEYLGVSGIGIAEVGSHPEGKAQVRDER